MKYFFFSILSIFIAFLYPHNILAQTGGTFLCQIENGSCVFLGGANCDTGYMVGNGCSTLSLNPSSPNYCEARAAFCDPDPNFGGNGEPCRENNLCDTGFTCASGTCQPTSSQPPPPAGGQPILFGGTCDGGNGIDTAIGCIPYSDPQALAQFFLRWAIGISGGIALIFIIYSTYLIMTSTGDPRRIQGGKELLTSSIAGVVLIIFSVFILRILGVNILGIF